MARVIRFAPQLGHWLTRNLDRGQAPAALVDDDAPARHGRRTPPRPSSPPTWTRAAAAWRRRSTASSCRTTPRPAPVARLAPGTRIDAGDREIVVHMRIEDPVCAALGNVLDADECRTLIEMARPRLEPSTLVDLATGQDIVSDKRASWGMFFRLEENEFIARLDRRLSR